mgnify:CR=1 FL=1
MQPETHTSIERVLSKLLAELHEIALHKGDLVLKAHLLGVLPRPLELEVVVVQANDLRVAELSDLAGRAANTASDVEHTHSGAEVHLRGKVVLMASKRCQESLSLVEAGEVERLRPSPLVEVGGTVVVACKNEIDELEENR